MTQKTASMTGHLPVGPSYVCIDYLWLKWAPNELVKLFNMNHVLRQAVHKSNNIYQHARKPTTITEISSNIFLGSSKRDLVDPRVQVLQFIFSLHFSLIVDIATRL